MVIRLDSAEMENTTAVAHDSIEGAQAACVEAGLPLVLTRSDVDPEKYLRLRYGFLVVIGAANDADAARWAQILHTARRPFVSIGVDKGWANHIQPDGGRIAQSAVEHLYQSGHRRIALVPRVSFAGKLRFGPEQVIPHPDLALGVYPFETTGGWDLCRANLEEAMGRAMSEWQPTGIVVGPDQFALFGLDYLANRGLRVPEDLSVVTCCPSVFSEWRGLRITRVDNPHREVARRAVEELIKMGGGGGYSCGRIAVAPALFQGETSRLITGPAGSPRSGT